MTRLEEIQAQAEAAKRRIEARDRSRLAVGIDTSSIAVGAIETLGEGGGEQWLPGRVVPPPARPYYVRFVVRDRPGILAFIAAALARQAINLDAVLQEPGYPKDALPFVITVEACEESALLKALAEIGAADFNVEPPLALPMLLGV